jgi:hypothetical protein
MNINDFNYIELSQNYDPIYDALINGGVVWMHLDYNSANGYYPNMSGVDGYARFMVTNWAITPMGLVIGCPDNSYLCFPNGSHTPSQPE